MRKRKNLLLLMCLTLFPMLIVILSVHRAKARLKTWKPIAHPILEHVSMLSDSYGTHPPSVFSSRRKVVAFLCSCATCKLLASQWANHLNKNLDVIVISSLGGGDTRQFRTTTGLSAVYLLDSRNSLRGQFGIGTCPHYYLLAEDGNLLMERDAQSIQPVIDQESTLINRAVGKF